MLGKFITVLVAGTALVAGIWMFQYQQTDFSTLDGGDHRWRDYQGRWVVVNYFAEWCAPCLKEVPELNGFAGYTQTRDDVSLFAVSYDALEDAELARIRDQYGMQFDLIRTGATHMPVSKPKSLPATYIIGPDGSVRKTLMGEQTNLELQQIIQHLQSL